MSTLEESEAQGNVEKNPALKLLDFVKSLEPTIDDSSPSPSLATVKAQESSETLRTVKPFSSSGRERALSPW